MGGRSEPALLETQEVPRSTPEHLPKLPFFAVTFLPGHWKTMSLRLCEMSVTTCTKPSCGINQSTQCLKVKPSLGWLLTRSAGANGPVLHGKMGVVIKPWLTAPWLPRGGNRIKRSVSLNWHHLDENLGQRKPLQNYKICTQIQLWLWVCVPYKIQKSIIQSPRSNSLM